jgi:hypothetical protein
VFPQPLLAAYGIVLSILGSPFAGWLFEQLAARPDADVCRQFDRELALSANAGRSMAAVI